MKTITRKCPACGNDYQADPERLKHGRQLTCSRKCSYIARAAKLSKQLDFVCPVCSKPFTRPPSTSDRSKHGSVFCSRKCHYDGRSLGLTKRVVKRPYTYTPDGKARLIASVSTPKGQRRFHPTTCSYCDRSFDDKSDGRNRKSGKAYCSLECCNAHRTGENNPAWRGGHPEYYGSEWRAARRAARKRDGKCCRRCGKMTSRALDVHHIVPVGSFKNPNDAHFLSNLVCLCHRCHMIVEWNGIDFPL
jgi:5-methylcytosine-specific restriction endonuclease McrA